MTAATLRACAIDRSLTTTYLETHTGNITNGVTGATKASNQHLVVVIAKVQATVSGDESGDLLAVLDELHPHAFTDGRVRLLGLNTDLLEHNTLGHGRAVERVGLQVADAVCLVVALAGPSLNLAVARELAAGVNTCGASATGRNETTMMREFPRRPGACRHKTTRT